MVPYTNVTFGLSCNLFCPRKDCVTSLKNASVEANRDDDGLKMCQKTNHLKEGMRSKSCVLCTAEDKCLTK